MIFLKKITLSIIAISCFFLSLELVQRARYSWGHKSSTIDFQIRPYNSLGFRGPKIKIKKDPGVLRLLFIGGSTTFGVFNPVEETFPYLTAQVLPKKLTNASVEVINAGRCGLTSSGELAQMERMFYLQPDIAVVMTGYNDSAAVYGDCLQINQRGTLHLGPFILPWYVKLDAFLQAHSVAYWTFKEKVSFVLHRDMQPMVSSARQQLASEGPAPADATAENEKKWFKCGYRKIFRRNLENMFQISARYRIELVFIKAPLSLQRRQEFPLYAKAYFSLMQEVEDFCERHRVPLIGLEDRIWDSGAQEYFHQDGLHFTKAGNALLASMLSDFFVAHQEILSKH